VGRRRKIFKENFPPPASFPKQTKKQKKSENPAGGQDFLIVFVPLIRISRILWSLKLAFQ